MTYPPLLTIYLRADPAKNLGGGGGGAGKSLQDTSWGRGGLRFKIIKDFVGTKGVDQDGGGCGYSPPLLPPPPGSVLVIKRLSTTYHTVQIVHYTVFKSKNPSAP